VRRSLLLLVAVALVPATARAEPAGFGFNLSGILGIGTTHAPGRDTSGIAWGVRPEALWRPSYASHWSYGAFVDIGSMGDAGVLFGTGGTLSIPLTGDVVIAPSAGVFTATVFDQGYAAGWTAGTFVGIRRANDISYFDASVGLRADLHRTFAGDRTGFSIALQLDLTLLAAFGSFM